MHYREARKLAVLLHPIRTTQEPYIPFYAKSYLRNVYAYR
jgi:hypothetical protein